MLKLHTGWMLTQPMEICLQQLVLILMSKFMIEEHPRSSKNLINIIIIVRIMVWLAMFEECSITFQFVILINNGNLIGLINCVRWNPAGNLLATASDDQSVHVWDIKAGKKIGIGIVEGRANESIFLLRNMHALI